MTNNLTNTNTPAAIPRHASNRKDKITFHPALHDQFEVWTKACGQHPAALRRASKIAIRTRHQEASFKHESHRARGRQPDIYTLMLESLEMYYTIEPHAIVIRGYGYEIGREPLDHFDGGGLYSEFEWSLPPEQG